MAKQVTLKIRIDKNGKLHAEPTGTEGDECLNLMEFIKRIPGISVLEMDRTDGGEAQRAEITNKQRLGE